MRFFIDFDVLHIPENRGKNIGELRFLYDFETLALGGEPKAAMSIDDGFFDEDRRTGGLAKGLPRSIQ